ncbi:hypothetical protein NC652_021844 [Populus alba x Populus x berolinensis]|nr:hypothetical protein NC652_021844 [Populus alba x Populus x berolinensis]
MPMEPSPRVWGVLVSASIIHGNAEMQDLACTLFSSNLKALRIISHFQTYMRLPGEFCLYSQNWPSCFMLSYVD